MSSDQMTRIADDLYVIADTLEQLAESFKEVFFRESLCGLTFKPSKLVIV